MDPMAMAWLGGGSIGLVLALLLAALILRSACDLCGVDPSPGYGRCLVVTIIQFVIETPLGLGMGFGVGLLTAAMQLPEWTGVVGALLLGVPAFAIIATIMYVIAFRVGVLKAALIWLIFTVLRSLVGLVILLLLVGGWVTVESVLRQF